MVHGRSPEPRENVPTRILCRNSFDEARESPVTLPISDCKVDMQQPYKRVRPILNASRLSLRRPGHDLPESMSLDSIAVVGSEHCPGNPSDILETENYIGEFSIVVDPRSDEGLPVCVIKFESFRR